MLQIHLAQDLKRIAERLKGEFGGLSRPRVERYVADAWKCAEHLGFEVTTTLVERVARERLQAVVNSAPPSAVTMRPPINISDPL